MHLSQFQGRVRKASIKNGFFRLSQRDHYNQISTRLLLVFEHSVLFVTAVTAKRTVCHAKNQLGLTKRKPLNAPSCLKKEETSFWTHSLSQISNTLHDLRKLSQLRAILYSVFS